jgi:carboxymethylenebutenolidase
MPTIKSAQDIRYRINGETTPGFLAVPQTTTPAAGIIVIQEVWGLNDDVRRICRMFAEAGYAALAPDLYQGKMSMEMEEARKLRMAMQMDRANKDVDVAIKYLKDLPEVRGGPVFMIGFCMGGGLVLANAIRGADIAAGASFYGGGQQDAREIAKIRVPMYCAYGADDQGIPPARVEEVRKALNDAKITNEVHVFQGAGHSFFNTARPDFHRPTQAKEAFEQVKSFFDRARQAQPASARR